jgi:hypothetical protein
MKGGFAVRAAVRLWWWKLDHRDRHFVMAGAAISVIALTAALLLQLWMDAQRRDITARASSVSQELARLQSLPKPADPNPDFVSSLPQELRTDRVVRDAAAWAPKFDLAIPALSVQPSNAAAGTLQNATLSVELNGSYANIKLWLRELLARYPELGLVSLDLQRAADPAAARLNANLQLRLYAKPRVESKPRLSGAPEAR